MTKEKGTKSQASGLSSLVVPLLDGNIHTHMYCHHLSWFIKGCRNIITLKSVTIKSEKN